MAVSGRLKIFADKAWLPPGKKHVIVLYPFWGNIPLDVVDPDYHRFDEYMLAGRDMFEMVERLSECDIAVLPFEYCFEQGSQVIAANAAAAAKAANKRLLVFFNSDNSSPIELDNSIVLRTSFSRATRLPNEFAFMGWSVDFVKAYTGGSFVPVLKKERPAISYCGYLATPKQRWTNLKRRMSIDPKRRQTSTGPIIRTKAVRRLLKDHRVKCDFIIRKGFWAEGMKDRKAARKEYAENMLNSPYALVARGAGNFSYRLYEVMSCGRIPVFINTDCVLPYENLIDWKGSCVWVEQAELDDIGEKVVRFHRSISQDQFAALQSSNRKLYEKWLSPIGFFQNLDKYFKNSIHQPVSDLPRSQSS